MEELFQRLSLLSEPVRVRLLAVLEHEELGVGELCRVVQLPQSTVSRHLKALRLAGLVRRRAEGTSSLFRMSPPEAELATLWTVVGDRFKATPLHKEDTARLRSLLEARRVDSRSFFGRIHGEWDSLRRDLFGEDFLLPAIAAMLPEGLVIADLGCGTGVMLSALAPVVQGAIGVDQEQAMLRLARERLREHPQVELRIGSLEDLPLQDHEVDIALCTLVLHHVDAPQRVFHEVARVLKPRGRWVLVDMLGHDRADWRHTMGHRWLGFDVEILRAWAVASGLTLRSHRALAPAPAAQGPPLFVAVFQR